MSSVRILRLLVLGIGVALCTECAPSSLAFLGPGRHAGVRKVKNSAAGQNLYVGSGWISEYRIGSNEPVRSVRAYYAAVAMASDRKGHLFSANGQPSYGAVSVYKRSTLELVRQISTVAPLRLAVDHLGYLYVSNSGDAVLVYGEGGELVSVIRRGIRGARDLAFSKSGELFVANSHSVSIYTPTKVAGRMQYVRSITRGTSAPYAIALTSSADVAVANCLTCFSNETEKHDDVALFKQGASSPYLILTSSIKRPVQIIADNMGTLYVANSPFTAKGFQPGWVTEYKAGTSAPSLKITEGINEPVALALGPSGDLYVANQSGNSVTVYRPGEAKPIQEIKRGTHYPASLLFSMN